MIKSIGHFLLGVIFISGGSNTFLNPDGRAKKVETAGIPNPHAATIVNGAVMTIGGTLLSLSLLPRLAALALLGTLVPTTLVGHPFWKEETPAGRTNQLTQFYKNIAMIGGLLLVLTEKKD